MQSRLFDLVTRGWQWISKSVNMAGCRHIFRQWTITQPARGAAIVFICCLPAGYGYLSYKNQATELEFICHSQSVAISALINRNPSTWRQDERQLATLLRRHNDHHVVALIIDGRPVSQINRELLKFMKPVIVRRCPVYESGAPVGQLELQESLYEWLLKTVMVSAFSMTAGILIFLTLYWTTHRTVHRINIALDDSENRYQSVVLSLQEGVIVVTAQGEIITKNNSALYIFGERINDWIRAEKCADWVITEEDIPVTADNHPLQQTLLTGKSFTRVVLGLRINEKTTWIAVNTQPLWHRAEQQPYAVVASIVDITERRDAKQKLRLAAQAFEHTADGVMVTDAHQRLISVNRAFTQITGYSPEEVIGKTPAILSSKRHGPDFYARMWKAINTAGFWQGEIYNRSKQGKIAAQWLSISVVKDLRGQPTHYIGAFSDISVKKRHEEQRVNRLVNYDMVTGLPNRAHFTSRCDIMLARAHNQGQGVAVFLIDLDNFKIVNDSMDHLAGEELLKAVGVRLQCDFCPDSLVGCLGGDNFVIAMDFRILDDVARRTQDLMQQFTLPFYVNGRELFISASVGVGCYPVDGQDTPTLLKHAEVAMYRVKESGRNGYQFFLANMNRDSREILDLHNRLRVALQRNEFLVYFQPRLSVATRQVAGVEALIRWRNPDLGMISPGKFIPLAEADGSILAIGAWILEAACRQMAEWRSQGLPIERVSVNLSARQFRDPDLIEQIQAVLTKTGLNPAHLELEITESMAMSDPQQTVTKLQTIKAMNIAVAIDDFGTGYSSLSYLRRFPFDYLKVDQSFIRDLLTDPAALAITDMIIALGKTLEVRLVAEGVERIEELAHLRQRDCDEVQGFYFARPMPADELADWIHSHVKSLAI